MSDERILDELRSQGQYTHEVIDLASVRVARGALKPRLKRCEHLQLVYSTSDRRIECSDCDQAVDPFDAFLTLTRHFGAMLAEVRSRQRKADEGLTATVHRRAAKALERSWTRMAPCCPHCQGGILPEDFANGVPSAVGREIEVARRKRQLATLRTEPQNDRAFQHGGFNSPRAGIAGRHNAPQRVRTPRAS